MIDSDNNNNTVVNECRGLKATSAINLECLYHVGFSREISADLLLSRIMKYSVNSDRRVDLWIEGQRRRTGLQTEIIPLDEITGWHKDPETGNIRHDSGRFFSVVGVYARQRRGDDEVVWDQPIIDQPEVGILGVSAKKIKGIMHFCLQAKEEPGNIYQVQLSPTVQATYSNFRKVHGGQSPPFLDMFMNPLKQNIIYSRMQSEDGGRFLFKMNRNIIVLTEGDEMGDLPERFIWLTLRQIRNLLRRDNMINACARSVLACLI